jgi:hypothetical protein
MHMIRHDDDTHARCPSVGQLGIEHAQHHAFCPVVVVQASPTGAGERDEVGMQLVIINRPCIMDKSITTVRPAVNDPLVKRLSTPLVRDRTPIAKLSGPPAREWAFGTSPPESC